MEKSKQLTISTNKPEIIRSKKIKIFLIVTTVVALLGVGLFFVYLKFFKTPSIFSPLISQPFSKDGISLNITEEKVVCPLCGKLVDKNKAKRVPLAVSIENHPASRPQSGLDKADLIYEALTEGQITRFLVFYACEDASDIGPVRSARTYFIDWLSEFDAFFAHCGGSITALDQITSYGILDLNQFYNAKAYWRTKDRLAPHNLYSSTEKLWELAQEKSWSLEGNYEGFKFKSDISSDLRPESQEIKVNYQDYQFKVRWVYNSENNNYLRFQGGIEHKDRVTGEQLAAKNIIVCFIPSTYPVITRIGEHTRKMDTIGSGKIVVFLDGKAITGTWKKTSRTSRTKYYNDQGEEIKLNPGQTWIEVVDPGTEISY